MSQTVDLASTRILIIDDQKPFQLMLRGLLHNMGARHVVAKSTGEAGVAAHHNQQFDVLLVDYNLGHGKNGRQVLEELRVRQLLRDDMVFFLITGDNSRPMVLSALELQPDDYLMKPFSQGLLRTRLQRAFAKRKVLGDVYRALYRQEYANCIAACERHIDADGRYANYCRKLIAELYLKIGQYHDAEKLLLSLLEEQRFTWGILALARTKLLQKQPDEALLLAEEVLKKNPNSVDAQDLITACHLSAERLEDALDAARKAVMLAPFSIDRQSTYARIARDNQEFELAKQAMHHVLEISRKSVFRDPRHLCGYLRSILDAAEHADDPRHVSKYQTEATLALQRARFDDNLVYSELNYSELENVVMARIEAFNGRYREAQKHLRQVTGDSLATDDELAAELAPDILSILLDIGEYEKADELADRLDKSHQLDDYNKRLLGSRFQRAEERQERFHEANKSGISAYKSGDFGEAVSCFTAALKAAPMNSGAALNYIQAAAKVLGESDKPNNEMVNEVKRCFRILEGLPLTAAHEQRYERLRDECKKLGIQ